MQKPSAIRKIAFLGDYLPRKCGIATFTTDLRCAVAASFDQSVKNGTLATSRAQSERDAGGFRLGRTLRPACSPAAVALQGCKQAGNRHRSIGPETKLLSFHLATMLPREPS